MKSMPGLARRNSWTALALPVVAVLMALCSLPHDRSRAGHRPNRQHCRQGDRRARRSGAERAGVHRSNRPRHALTPDGSYTIGQVPAGTHLVRTRLIGFRPDSASVTVTAGQQATHDFTIRAGSAATPGDRRDRNAGTGRESEVERRDHDAQPRSRSSSRSRGARPRCCATCRASRASRARAAR